MAETGCSITACISHSSGLETGLKHGEREGEGLLVTAYSSLKDVVSLLPDLGLQQLILLSLAAVLGSSFRNHALFPWQQFFSI